jgi:hypothetical protein
MAKATVVLLVIDEKTGTLVDPLPARAEPDSSFAFVLVNQHTDKFDLKIDFDEIVLKQAKTTKANPFVNGGPSHRQLNKGEIDLITQKIRPAIDFGSAALPYTTYKYTVILKNISTGVTLPSYDPDIDVPPS